MRFTYLALAVLSVFLLTTNNADAGKWRVCNRPEGCGVVARGGMVCNDPRGCGVRIQGGCNNPGGCGVQIQGGCNNPGGCGVRIQGGCNNPGGCGVRVGNGQGIGFIGQNGEISGLLDNVGNGGVGGVVDPSLSASGVATNAPTILGHISGNEAVENGNGYQETVNGTPRQVIVANGTQVVMDPRTKRRLAVRNGQLIVDNGQFVRDQFGNTFPVFQPASTQSVKKILDGYDADGDKDSNPLKRAVRGAYADVRAQLGASGSGSAGGGGQGTLPGGGGQHTGDGPANPQGTRPTDPGTKPKSTFTKWEGLFNNAANVKKEDIHSLTNKFTTDKDKGKPVEGKPNTSVRVLKQECVNPKNAEDRKPVTVYVFSTKKKVKEGEKEVEKIDTHLVLKENHETENAANISAAWDLAKKQDVQRDGTTPRDLGTASTPDGFDKTTLVSWFKNGPEFVKKWPALTESQVQIRPVMSGENVTDFATRYVFKNKDNPSQDWPFYCKTKPENAPDGSTKREGETKPEGTQPEPEKKPDAGAEKAAKVAAAKAAAHAQIKTDCFSCHGPGKDREKFGDTPEGGVDLQGRSADALISAINSEGAMAKFRGDTAIMKALTAWKAAEEAK